MELAKPLAWYNADGEMYVGEEALEGDGWTQDEDVLDTWFSVRLFATLSTMAGLMLTQKTSNATQLQPLVTGYDIFFGCLV